MKRCTILLILILSLTVLLGVPLLSARTPIELLKPKFGSALPEGPSPGNKTHYKTFTFDLNLPKIEDGEYYSIIAELQEVTKYEGSCANYMPDALPRKEDLLFHKDDYPTKAGGWKYESWKKLSVTLKSDTKDRRVPGQVSVRCYDWGAYGELTLTFKKKTGLFSWDTDTDTETIPLDGNRNKIGDGWENDGTKNWKVDKDDEHVPAGNMADGDGWTVYDEYRGLILTDADKEATRLNPAAKDVMFCSESILQKHGTGSVEPPHHKFHTIEEAYVLNALDYIWNGLGKVSSDTSEDKGWVNQYSKGGKGYDRVPGYTPVWAIRVRNRKGLSFGGKELRDQAGVAIQGSPSQSSLALVFKENIEEEDTGIIDRWYARAKIRDKRIVPLTAAEKRAIADAMISVAISHEVAHCLDLTHCEHANCMMSTKVKSKIDWKIRKGPGADGIVGTDDDDIVGTNAFVSGRTRFDKAHNIAYAATGEASFNVAKIMVPEIEMPPEHDDTDDGADAMPMLSPSDPAVCDDFQLPFALRSCA